MAPWIHLPPSARPSGLMSPPGVPPASEVMRAVVHGVVAFVMDTGRMALSCMVQLLVLMLVTGLAAVAKLCGAVRMRICTPAACAVLSLDLAAMGSMTEVRLVLTAFDAANAMACSKFENGRVANLGFPSFSASSVMLGFVATSVVACSAHN